MAECLRQRIAQLSFPSQDKFSQITISLEVDYCQKQDEDFFQILKRANQALSIAKRNGYNQVCCLSFNE